MLKRRLFTLLLSVAMMFSMLDVVAVAQSISEFKVCGESWYIGDYRFETWGDGAYITGYIGEDTDIVIPSELNSQTLQLNVIGISSYAFANNNNITSVVIPNSVSRINDHAFFNCDSLSSVMIGNGVWGIDEYAFSDCDKLTDIIIPNSVWTLGHNSFSECKSLSTVVIPESVWQIDSYAFYNCSSLTNVTIPSNVTDIGFYAFRGTPWFENYSMKFLIVGNGILLKYNGDDYEVKIPNNVTSIGENVFGYCSKLTSITIPDSVTSIGYCAFQDCTSLTSISIPESVTSIGISTFIDCTSLTSVTIPDSVTSIGDWAFDGCESLSDVYYAGSEEDWNKITIESGDECLTNATIHYNSNGGDTPKPSPVTVSHLSITAPSTLDIGEEQTVTITPYDEDGNTLSVDNVSLSYTFSDTSVVTANTFVGNTLTIKGAKAGETTLMVTDEKSGKSVIMLLKVTDSGNKKSDSEEYWISFVNGKLTNMVYLMPEGSGTKATVTIDSKTYDVTEDFDVESVLKIYNSDKKSVVAKVVNGKVDNVKSVLDVIEPKAELSFDPAAVSYSQGEYDNNKINCTVTISVGLKEQFNRAKVEGTEAEDVQFDVSSVLLESENGFLKVDGGLFDSAGSSYEKNLNKTVSMNNPISFDVTLKLGDYVPSQQKSSCTVAATLKYGDNKKKKSTGTLVINNLDEKAKQDLKKQSKHTTDPGKELKNFELLLDKTPLSSAGFSKNQINQIEKSIKAYIATVMVTTSLEQQDFSKSPLLDSLKDVISADTLKRAFEDSIDDIIAELDVDFEGGSLFDFITSVSFDNAECNTKITVYNEKKKKDTVIYVNVFFSSLGVDNFSSVGSFGKVSYNFERNGKEYSSDTSLFAYADVQSFYNAALQYAHDEVANQLADAIQELSGTKSFTGKFVTNGLSSALTNVMFGAEQQALLNDDLIQYESNKGYNIYQSEPVTKSNYGVFCPVDVYIYDSEYNLRGSVVNNKVELVDDSLYLYCVGDEKFFSLIGDDNIVKFVGNDLGTMRYVIEEYINDELVRKLEYNDIPLAEEKTYYALAAQTSATATAKAPILFDDEDAQFNIEEYIYETNYESNTDFDDSDTDITSETTPDESDVDTATDTTTVDSDTDTATDTKPTPISDITNASFKDNALTIDYSASTNCKLVAAVYNSKTDEMLKSHSTNVKKGNGSISFEFNSMPKQFYVKVFLLDENYYPLCDNYYKSFDVNSSRKAMPYVSGDTQTWEDYEYSENDDGSVSIVKYNGSDSNVTIPAYIDEKKVKGIASLSFSGNTSLTNIIIPNTVECLVWDAFYKCNRLESVSIPWSVTQIDFFMHTGKTGVDYDGCLSLTSINVDAENQNYASIDGVLYNKDFTSLMKCPCKKTNITIPSTVTKLDYFSFLNCASLTEINIPDSVTEMRSQSFEGCNALKSIYIPKGVDNLHIDGEIPFNDCKSLTRIDVDENNENYSSEDGVLYNKDKTTLLRCPRNKSSITLPPSVTTIRMYAFLKCDLLTTIPIHNSIASFGNSCFAGCTSIIELTIPSLVTKFDNDMISGCASLATINVDSENKNYASVDGILYNKEITELILCPHGKTELLIPYTVTTIASSALNECILVDRITVASDNNYYTSVDDVLYNKDITELIFCPYGKTDIFIPMSVSKISNNAFVNRCLLETINVDTRNKTYYSVDGVLYKNGENDKNGVVRCPLNKKAVVIDEGTQNIGYEAFQDCKQLKTITIPSSITGVGAYAFLSCQNLTEVYYMGTKNEWDKLEIKSGNECLTSCRLYCINDISNMSIFTVTLSNESYTYSQKPIQPISSVKKGDTDLVLNTDYSIEFANDINVGTATATIKGIGNYTGSVVKEYTINPKKLTDNMVHLGDDPIYNGEVQYPEVTVKDDDITLNENIDYTLKFDGETIDAGGPYGVTVFGIGNYANELYFEYAIFSKDIGTAEVTLNSYEFVYDGKQKKPVVTVKDGDNDLKTSLSETEKKDYIVSYSDNIDVGTATVTVTGEGNYCGTKSVTYSIIAAPFESDTDTSKSSDTYSDTDFSTDMNSDTEADSSADTDSDPDADTSVDTDIDSETDTTADTDNDTETDTSSDTDSDSETDTPAYTDNDTETDTSSDTDSDSEMDTSIDTDSDTETDTSTDTDSDTETDTSADADSDTETDTSADTDSDTETDKSTDTDSDTDSDLVEPPKKSTKEFTNLVKNGKYVFMIVRSLDVDDLTADDNLIYIDQYTANDDAVVTVEYPEAYQNSENILLLGPIPDENKDPIGNLGDLDGDVEVTSADALIALRISAQLDESTPEKIALGDIDGDGEITSADALELLRFSAMLSTNDKIGKSIA